MTNKVTHIHLIAPKTPEPHPGKVGMIEMLERMLQRVKDEEVTGLMVGAVTQDGSWVTNSGGTVSKLSLIGMLTTATHDLIHFTESSS